MKKLVWLFLVVVGAVCRAHTMEEEEFTCPLCENKFTQVMDMSGTEFGRRLDLKPEGATAAPWSIPRCTKCHFILFKGGDGKSYTTDETSALRQFVETESYRSAAKVESTYYLLGLILIQRKEPSDAVGYAFLQASWEVDVDGVRCRRYLQIAAKHYDIFLGSAESGQRDTTTAQLLKGEFLRRLGHFAEAAKHFIALKSTPGFDKPVLQDIIVQQLKLVDERDSAPHSITVSPKRKRTN